MTSPRRASWAAAGTLLVCLVSCPAPGFTRSARTHVIEIRGFQFVPASLRVAAGDTVVWVNRDAVPHTATGRERGFDTGAIAAGARREIVVRKAGKQPYICVYHPSMTGQLEVR